VPNEAFTFGSFQLVPSERTLLDDGKPLRLGSRALDILVTLVEHAGQTVHNDELIARAWPGTFVDEVSLRVNIAALRRTLGDGRDGNRFIANVPGRGYIFVAPATRALIDQLTDRPGGALRGDDIPTSLTRIIGRDDTIASLVRQLARRRLVAIVGPGGVGKTTVAAAVANAAHASYPDGAHFVALASLPSPDLVPSALASVLGIPLPGANSISGLAAWLRDKQALIVLDSCEHVIGTTASLAEAIVASAPGVSVLATSREPLRARGEWRHRLAPLEFPSSSDDLSAGDALRFSAIQLFYERASATGDGFPIDDDDMAVVVKVCRRLDGIPLALELAAAHAGVLGIKELAAWLDDCLGLMIRGRRTSLPRHQTLRAMLDWSHNLLPTTEQIIFRRLAVFRGNFLINGAAVVAADAELAPDQVVNGVANLVDKSLVTADIGGDVTYYHLLDMTRAYALQKLLESGEHDQVGRLHAQYFHELLGRSEAGFAVHSRGEWRTDYRRMIDNLHAALDWAFSPNGDTSIGILLAATLTPFWVQMSLMSECRRYIEIALTHLNSGANQDARIEMILNAALGASLTYTTGPVPETVAAWSRTLQLAESLDDTEYRLRALRGLWSYRMNGGEYRAALALANEFCGVAEREADPNTSRAGDRMASLILHYLGDQADARKRIEWSMSTPVATSQPPPTTQFMIDQGVAAHALFARILWLQGFPDQARCAAESAVRQAEAANHAISQCHALAQAACPVTLWIGDLAEADRFVTMLIDLASKNALEGWIARGQCFRSVLLIQRGLLADGLARLQIAVQALRVAGSMAEHPAFLAVLAHAFHLDGKTQQGQAAIDEAIGRSENTEERWCTPELLRIKGEILLSSDGPGSIAAEEAFRQSLDVARRKGALSWELRTATCLARLLRGRDRRHAAHALLAPIYNRFSEGFQTADLKAAKLLLDELL
jgi:predicted ATPase/DNA-binding winged helix-turn-helix (wHTH) protein